MESKSARVALHYENEFKGLLWSLGVQGNHAWVNPIDSDVLIYASSTGYGHVNSLISYDFGEDSFGTANLPGSCVTIEFLRHRVKPSSYALAHSANAPNIYLRTWVFEASNDERAWEVLCFHHNDQTLNNNLQRALFPILNAQNFFRSFRIRLLDRGTSNMSNVLVLSGIEIFGTIEATLTDLTEQEQEEMEEALGHYEASLYHNGRAWLPVAEETEQEQAEVDEAFDQFEQQGMTSAEREHFEMERAYDQFEREAYDGDEVWYAPGQQEFYRQYESGFLNGYFPSAMKSVDPTSSYISSFVEPMAFPSVSYPQAIPLYSNSQPTLGGTLPFITDPSMSYAAAAAALLGGYVPASASYSTMPGSTGSLPSQLAALHLLNQVNPPAGALWQAPLVEILSNLMANATPQYAQPSTMTCLSEEDEDTDNPPATTVKPKSPIVEDTINQSPTVHRKSKALEVKDPKTAQVEVAKPKDSGETHGSHPQDASPSSSSTTSSTGPTVNNSMDDPADIDPDTGEVFVFAGLTPGRLGLATVC